jgi:hypothetical protein
MILLSADGWSVPAIATLLACCRGTVRKWLHAFDLPRLGWSGWQTSRASSASRANGIIVPSFRHEFVFI